jgi:GTPase SAR1 family protein
LIFFGKTNRTNRKSFPKNSSDAKGAILVYDVTKMQSFQKLETWLEELEINTNSNITKMIVGNKIDLQSDRVVDRAMGLKFAKQQRALFMETSAESNINVGNAFEELVRKVLDDNIFDDSPTRDIRLDGGGAGQNSGGSSCGGFCG